MRAFVTDQEGVCKTRKRPGTPRNTPEHPQDTPEYPETPPDGPDLTPLITKIRPKKLQNQKKNP